MEAPDISTESTRLGPLARRVQLIGGGGGLAALLLAGLVAWLSVGWGRFIESWLISFAFVLTLGLGALFFVLLQHLTRAGWSVVVRRLAEGMTALIPLSLVLLIPVLLGVHHLYHWSHADVVAHDPLLAGKAGYLNLPFFILRLAGYFAVWLGLAHLFWRRSVEQDQSGDPSLTASLERWSAPGMVLFALTLNFAAFDLLMSLDPHWFSTIYGVYVFAGATLVHLSVLPLALHWLQRSGRLRYAVTAEHYHDLGKLMFAFTVFWAYIAFSQYMLIWYGNVPEETQWFLKRQVNGWQWVSLGLLFGHFVLPFLALISRHVKRRPALLQIGAIWLIVMHWLDLYWLVMPEFHERPVIGLVDLLLLAGMVGLAAAVVAWRLAGHSLVPRRDPRLDESLAFENM